MEYHKLVSVTGLGGLFELLSSKSDGAVVRSLEDKTTRFVSNRKHNFSHLESIEVYTTKDNASLADLLLAMKSSEEKIPDSSAETKELKSYFEKVYPELDFERVYASDMKKMVKWFTVLTENKIEIKKRSEEEIDESGDTSQSGKKLHQDPPVSGKNMKPQQANPRKIESRGVK